MGHILIVDDMPDNRRLFSEILDSFGHSYDTAASAQEAVAKCSSQLFELIFMDISIPIERGHETDLFGGIKATRIILSLPSCRSIPIIAVTAHGMESQKRAILDCGIKALVEKGTERFIEEVERQLCLYVATMPKRVDQPEFSSAKTLDDIDLKQIITLEESLIAGSDSVAIQSTVRGSESRQNSKSELELASRPKPNRDGVHSFHDAMYDDLVRSSDPRAAMAKVIDSAMVSTERYIHALRELDRDEDQIANACNLVALLKEIFKKLSRPEQFPIEGSSLPHWAINLLVRVPGMLEKMERQEFLDFHRQLSDDVSPIRQKIRAVLDFAKSQHAPSPSVHEVRLEKLKQSEEVLVTESADHFVANVLIVDDSSDARLDLEEKVRKLKHRPYSCSSAEDALDMLSFRSFDVCLLDMQMPGVDGMEMIRRIRETARTSHLPIIVVSGSCHDSTGAEAIEMGANDFLAKPAVERLLQARINACLRQTLARKAELAKFLPEAVIESVLLDDSVLHVPKVADITVMVCDIRGFSKISETKNPVETIRWISDVMNRLSDIILAQGGTIVDYVGDEIMAMWGAPGESLSHPEEACRCAALIQSEVAKLSVEWYPRLMTSLEIGIGIHSGMAVCGNTGSKQRIKYGPLGNTVNLASRVQGATKYLHCSVLVTSDTANRVSPDMRGRRICKIRVQNLQKPVELYELITETSENYRNQTQPLNQYYEEALEAFEGDDIVDALKRTAQILVSNPEDGPTKLLMLRVLQASLEQKFDPVWTMPGK